MKRWTKTKQCKALSIFCCISLLLSGVGIFAIGQKTPQPVMAAISQPPATVILDPGHGGMDGGAQANGVSEKQVNLAIALDLKELLSAMGFRVIMTREDDRSIHDPQLTQVGRQKRSDLHNRLKLMQQNPQAIFVSIHQNKFEESWCSGAQIFYSPNHPDSQKLAALMQRSFSALQPDNQRQIKEAGNNLFLLYEGQNPAVMAECGFLSNPDEAAALSDRDYQKKVAFVLMQAILEFYAQQ